MHTWETRWRGGDARMWMITAGELTPCHTGCVVSWTRSAGIPKW